MLEDIADLVRQKRPDLIVKTAHMELADPTIEQGFENCVKEGATHITVHPYMLAPGRHATQDIPKMAQDAAKAHPNIQVTLTPPLGVHPNLADLILQRADI